MQFIYLYKLHIYYIYDLRFTIYKIGVTKTRSEFWNHRWIASWDSATCDMFPLATQKLEHPFEHKPWGRIFADRLEGGAGGGSGRVHLRGVSIIISHQSPSGHWTNENHPRKLRECIFFWITLHYEQLAKAWIFFIQITFLAIIIVLVLNSKELESSG